MKLQGDSIEEITSTIQIASTAEILEAFKDKIQNDVIKISAGASDIEFLEDGMQALSSRKLQTNPLHVYKLLPIFVSLKLRVVVELALEVLQQLKESQISLEMADVIITHVADFPPK